MRLALSGHWSQAGQTGSQASNAVLLIVLSVAPSSAHPIVCDISMKVAPQKMICLCDLWFFCQSRLAPFIIGSVSSDEKFANENFLGNNVNINSYTG